jgi:PadR family transcriptional regulator PadR
MTAPRKDVPQGTLDLLILRIIAREPMHGWGIMQRLGQLTSGVFQVTPGALFPALQRLEQQGWATTEWGTSENNRRARFYSISAAGRKQLTREEKEWQTITLAVTKVLEGA